VLGINLQALRYLAAVAVGLVLLVLVLVIGLALYRGADLNSSQLISLLGVLGTLVGVLTALVGVGTLAVQTQGVQKTMSSVEENVNGHLAAHIGHTDQQIADLVDQRLRAQGVLPDPEQGRTT